MGGLDLVDAILTDSGADPDDLRALREAGATVIVAGEPFDASLLSGRGNASAPEGEPGVGVS